MNSAKRYDFIIIGSGPAGQKAAVQCAKAGRTVAIIEAERHVGGACVRRGTIPSKTLRESAVEMRRLKRNAEIFSFELRPDLEISNLMSRLNSVIEAHNDYMSNQLDRAGIDVLHGRARFLSKNSVDLTQPGGSQSTLTAEFIIIATGSSPRDPDDIPVDHEHILDSDSILSMVYLPESLTILGGGVIASEYASIFSSLGVKVTMVDARDRPLGFIEAEFTDRFVANLEKDGGRFVGGCKATDVYWDGVSKVITTLDSGERLESERLLFALGRTANIQRLAIEAAGLEPTSRGYVAVNEHGQTSVPNIYAAGDVVGPPGLASAAMEQGRGAACHALGIGHKGPAPLIPMGIYTIPEISTVGLTEAEAIKKFGGAIVGRAEFCEIARGQISGNSDGLLKLVADPQGRRLLGVQVFGEGATELVHVGQMGLIAECDVDWFVDHVFNFPTMCEAYRDAALAILDARAAKPVKLQAVAS